MTSFARWCPVQRVRLVAIGIVRRQDQLRVFRVLDDHGQRKGLRPPGGEVEFGEPTRQALLREFREELQAEIVIEGEPVVLENIFEHPGAIGHEIVFAYPVRPVNSELYLADGLVIREDDGTIHPAEWLDLEQVQAGWVPLFPIGLLGALSGLTG